MDTEKAILAIIEHLGRPRQYAVALVARLTEDEALAIAQHGRHENGAVGIAAVIYQARRRMGDYRAEAEAAEHHAVICKTVRVLSEKRQRRPQPTRRAPGIRVVATPSE